MLALIHYHKMKSRVHTSDFSTCIVELLIWAAVEQ